MKKNILLLNLLLTVLLTGNVAMAADYTGSYTLSPDGKTLLTWTGSETVVDMNSDVNLAEVTTIQYFKTGQWAYNTTLQSVIIGDKVQIIAANAFTRCTNLANVTFPHNGVLTAIRGQAFSQTGITTIDIPEGVYLDPAWHTEVFLSCTSLTSAKLPNSMTRIPNGTFASCTSLQSVTFGNSVISFGNNVFTNCSSLETITINTHTPPTVTATTFAGITQAGIALNPPSEESKTLYMAADYWKNFFISTSVESEKIAQNINVKVVNKHLYINNDNNIEFPLDIYTLSGQKIYSDKLISRTLKSPFSY